MGRKNLWKKQGYTLTSAIGGCMFYIKIHTVFVSNNFRCGEAEKLEMRYREFHLGALVDAAVAATRKDRDHGNRCKYST